MRQGLVLVYLALSVALVASQCVICDDASTLDCSSCNGGICSKTIRTCMECPRIVCEASQQKKTPAPAIWVTAIAGGILALIALIAAIIYRRTHLRNQQVKRSSNTSMIELISRMAPVRANSNRSRGTMSNHAPVLPYPVLTRASNLSLNFHRVWHSKDIQFTGTMGNGRTISQSSIDLGAILKPVRITNGLASMDQKSPMSMLSHRLNAITPPPHFSEKHHSMCVSSSFPLPSPVQINPPLVSPVKPVEFGFSPSPSPVHFFDTSTHSQNTNRFSTSTALIPTHQPPPDIRASLPIVKSNSISPPSDAAAPHYS
ncbi:hypothetical protein DSO57_1008703 [Entomophthora muscae]|uniref:Uncharacterized protein n=1 Tax=Entomophthora muscae TaxID=34485 RepID=A0ACC2SW56_9FUNG|nr:hypothetical protein DSO57_1008703 [Entomophthora muscae]